MLDNLLNKHRAKLYDCYHGKWGERWVIYCYNIKHKHNMDPLAVTFRPIMEHIGQKNLILLLIVATIIYTLLQTKKQ